MARRPTGAAPGLALRQPFSSAALLWACVGLALLLHAALGLGREGLWGGGDLVPHLRLIQTVSASPGLYNPYAPAYHWLGAALTSVVSLEVYPKLFGFAAALALLAGFRSFQRAASLPDASTAVFALTPFLLSFSWCVPRVEALGYALLLFGLGALLRGRRLALALALGACFYVHTAAALLFGLTAGILALVRRDAKALVALAVGALAALPLVLAHTADGCTFAQALLFAPGGYARSLREELLAENWPWLLPLASPFALAAAVLGARSLWRWSRPLAVFAAALVALWGVNFWLAPFDIRTLVTPLRGLSVLAIPVAMSAGLWAAAGRWRETFLLGLCAGYALLACPWVVPQACYVRQITLAELDGVHVERCEFLWRAAPAAAAAAARQPAVRLAGEASDGLVYVHQSLGGVELWRARLIDKNTGPLLARPGKKPAWPFWSSAAGKLLFQAESEVGQGAVLMLLDPGSGRVEPLASRRYWREHWGAWSPDGKRVAYAFVSGRGPRAKAGVAEVDVATHERRVLDPGRGPYAFFRPEYLSDGLSLLAQRRGALVDSFSELWVIERDLAPRRLPGEFPRFADKASLTRDGAWIVYTGRDTEAGPGDVLLTRPDGSESRPLVAAPDSDEHSARPSPTRDEVAFISDRDGNPDLFLVDLAGGAPRNLTQTPDLAEAAPRWSPNGERLVVSATPTVDDLMGSWIRVVDREGNRLLETQGRMPDWMPPWPDR